MSTARLSAHHDAENKDSPENIYSNIVTIFRSALHNDQAPDSSTIYTLRRRYIDLPKPLQRGKYASACQAILWPTTWQESVIKLFSREDDISKGLQHISAALQILQEIGDKERLQSLVNMPLANELSPLPATIMFSKDCRYIDQFLHAGAATNPETLSHALHLATSCQSLLMDIGCANSSGSARIPLLQKLLDAGAKINATNASGKTVLDHCIENQFSELTNFLRERGAKTAQELSALDAEEKSPYAELWQHIQTEANRQSASTQSLTRAIFLDSPQARTLQNSYHAIPKGRPISEAEKIKQSMCKAVLFPNEWQAKIQTFSPLLARTHRTYGAHATASLGWFTDIVPLLQQGINEDYRLDETTSLREFIIQRSTATGDASMMARLLDLRSDNRQATGQELIKIVSSQFPAESTVNELIEAKADVNFIAPDGRTPLIAAAMNPDCPPLVIAALIEANANPSYIWRGRSALEIAFAARPEARQFNF